MKPDSLGSPPVEGEGIQERGSDRFGKWLGGIVRAARLRARRKAVADTIASFIVVKGRLPEGIVLHEIEEFIYGNVLAFAEPTSQPQGRGTEGSAEALDVLAHLGRIDQRLADAREYTEKAATLAAEILQMFSVARSSPGFEPPFPTEGFTYPHPFLKRPSDHLCHCGAGVFHSIHLPQGSQSPELHPTPERHQRYQKRDADSERGKLLTALKQIVSLQGGFRYGKDRRTRLRDIQAIAERAIIDAEGWDIHSQGAQPSELATESSPQRKWETAHD